MPGIESEAGKRAGEQQGLRGKKGPTMRRENETERVTSVVTIESMMIANFQIGAGDDAS